MSLFKKKITTIALVLTLLLSSNISISKIFADSINNEKQITSEVINNQDIESANKKISRIIDKLSDYLEEKNITKLEDDTIANFFAHHLDEPEKITGTEILSVINKSKEVRSQLKLKGYSDEEILNSQIMKSVTVNDSILIEVFSNGTFTVEELENNNLNQSKDISARASITASARKDYTSWVGMHIYTVSAIGTFSYNGSTATLQSGTNNSYIKRGTLSIWQVSDKVIDGGTRGSSAYAKISGNLHYGFEIDGVGLVVEDYYLMHEVVCDRSGNITRNMIRR